MKVIVTGTTGQIGSAVLQACLKDPAVTHIFSVTRRALPSNISSSKLTSIIHSDFKEYPESLLTQLAGADTCIWTLGTIPRKGDGSLESYKKTDVDCTRSGASAFIKTLAPQLGGKKFRFVYISAWVAERDSSKKLWMMSGPRFSKGMAESALVDLRTENPDAMEVFFARPGMTMNKSTFLPDAVLWSMYSSREDQLAAALVDIAKNGYKNEIVHARELAELGMELSKSTSSEK